jgi:hypothetical protein
MYGHAFGLGSGQSYKLVFGLNEGCETRKDYICFMLTLKRFACILAASLLVLMSCKNDLDLLTDYHSTMVVYGILDPSDTATYIKIGRTFAGEGNAYEMAKQFDSLNYKGGLIVTLERIKYGSVQQMIPLYLDSAKKEEPGLFSYPKQYLYKTTGPIMQDGSTYRLKVVNTSSGETVTATTPVVQQLQMVAPGPAAATIEFADTITPFVMHWKTAKHGKLYQPMIRFNYDEHLVMDPSQVKHMHLDWRLRSSLSLGTDGGQDDQVIIPIDDFYRFLSSSLSPNSTLHRKVISLDLMLYIGADELNTYMEVSQANQETFNEDIFYSNVEGGVGLFSSRYTYYDLQRTLDSRSMDSLLSGRFTRFLGFIP